MIKKPKKKELWKVKKDGEGKDDGNWCGWGMMHKAIDNCKYAQYNKACDDWEKYHNYIIKKLKEGEG